jgi:hypothetical protein
LAVGLRVVAGGEVTSDLEHVKKVFPKFRYELRSMIADDTIRKAMMPTYFMHDNFGGFFTGDLLSTRQEMSHLYISNYYSEDCIEPLRDGRSVMKCNAMDCRGSHGIGNGSNKPYG